MAKKITTKDLSKAAQEAGFSIVGKPVSTRFIDPVFGEINLKEISVKQATYLVSQNYKHLKLSAKETGKRTGK